MVIDRYLHVRCVNKQCTDPADTDVPLPVVAPGVVAVPSNLRCRACSWNLVEDKVEVGDAAQQG